MYMAIHLAHSHLPLRERGAEEIYFVALPQGHPDSPIPCHNTGQRGLAHPTLHDLGPLG